MWAIRRASKHLRDRAIFIRTFQNSYPYSQVASRNLYDNTNNGDSHISISDRCTCCKSSLCHCTIHGYAKLSLGWCSFSSQAGTKDSDIEEDDIEDAFSELENPSETDDESSSEPDISEEEKEDTLDNTKEPQDEPELSDSEEIVPWKGRPKKKVSLVFYGVIKGAPSTSLESVLDKWVEAGNKLNQAEISEAMYHLRQQNMYARALQVSEWLATSKHFEYSERNYATRIDLIAKVHGLHAAESYINKIPESFKNEVIYRTLLANCVSSKNIKKSESVFNKMKELGLSLSTFSCNQMLLLYKRKDIKKAADVLLLMEKESVKPTRFTYGILIDMKGEANDIPGMEQIFETMKEEGIEPDLHIHAILAKHYVNSGFKEKAESVLRAIEGDDLSERKWVCNILLPLYGSLKRGNDVARVWKVCEVYPRLEDCIAATIAWGKLGNIEKAEEAFQKMTKITKQLSAKNYSPLLRVYANHKLVKKGKDLVTRMAESGITVGPQTWDDLVRLYLFAGEVEKADSILEKATQNTQMKPYITSYLAIMNRYAKAGDVHSTEKLFYKMRLAGYTCHIRQYEALLRAYLEANLPPYGIRERMKADNIFPNGVVMSLLGKVDPFRKTPVSALLD